MCTKCQAQKWTKSWKIFNDLKIDDRIRIATNSISNNLETWCFRFNWLIRFNHNLIFFWVRRVGKSKKAIPPYKWCDSVLDGLGTHQTLRPVRELGTSVPESTEQCLDLALGMARLIQFLCFLINGPRWLGDDEFANMTILTDDWLILCNSISHWLDELNEKIKPPVYLHCLPNFEITI